MEKKVIEYLLAAVVCGLASLFTKLVQSKKTKECSATTTAVLSEYQRNVTGSGADNTSIEYHPIYSYSIDGTEYKYKSSVNSNRPGKDVGSEFVLHYKPDKPTLAYVDRDIKTFGHLIIGFGFAAICLAIIAIYYYMN